MIYLDNNATTQIAPSVFDAMRPFLEGEYGNPSSSHSLGTRARKAVDQAREQLAEFIGASSVSEITFTSGGTESDNWAIRAGASLHAEKKHIVTTAVEHEAVRKVCEALESQGYEVTWLGVNKEGQLDLDELGSVLTENTALVSIMMANNETGILFPVKEIGEIVRSRSKALFHVDAVNAAGKVPINLAEWEVDLLSLSAHKFHGPKGVGALYIRDGLELTPAVIGGGQEFGRRAGTEAVHQVVGMGAAAEFVSGMSTMDETRSLRDRLENEILENIPNSRLNGVKDLRHRLPNTSSISFENTNGEMILHRLDQAGVCVSTGSACNAHDQRASAVLTAMDVPYSWAMGSIRFSWGRLNRAGDGDQVIRVLPGIVAELRSMAGIRDPD